MDYNNDLEDAFEALNNNRLHIVCTNQNSSTNKTLTRKQFNNTINKMLHELQNTPLKDFDTKKEEIVNWAKYNYYKVSVKDRPFETFMNSLRLYIFKLKKEAPRQTLEERKAKAKKELLYLLKKLEQSQSEYEFGITENQICNIVDRFDDSDKSEKIRIQLNELRQNWEQKRKNPF